MTVRKTVHEWAYKLHFLALRIIADITQQHSKRRTNSKVKYLLFFKKCPIELGGFQALFLVILNP